MTSEISSASIASTRTEGKVERLGREVTDDVGSVATPQRNETLVAVGADEGVTDTLVRAVEAALLDLVTNASELDRERKICECAHHLALVLNQELDTLNGRSSGF